MDKYAEFIINFNEAKNQLVSCINEAYKRGIPYTIIEPVVSDIYHQVQYGASAELTNAIATRKKEMTEAKEETNESNNA